MSFGMPTIRPRDDESALTRLDAVEEIHEPQKAMLTGVPASMSKPQGAAHALEASESNWNEHQDKIRMTVLRNTQGIHAPFRLMMERRAVANVCRLPCLPSHHLALDVLTGNDETIGFEDVLGGPEVGEVIGQPHAMLEKRLGLL